MRIDNWKNLSDEIWLSIFERLSLKNQVRLACTCTRLYRISLDKTLDNTGKRALQYLKVGLPVPSLLAKSVEVLRLPMEGIQASSTFVKEQILRMENLQVLILEEAGYEPYTLTDLDIQALFSCQHLREVRLASPRLSKADCQSIDLQDTYLYAAIKSRNLSIVKSLEESLFRDEISLNILRDSNDKTPTQLAIEIGDEDMVAYFIKKGGGAEWYILMEKMPHGPVVFCKFITSLSFVEKSLLYGSRLTVDFLRKEDYARFFQILETNVTIFNLEFCFKCGHSADSEQGLEERRLFIRDLAKALEKNTTLRILDLKEWKDFLPADITPLLHCERLEDLWLSSSLLEAQLESQQTFLHMAVHLRNIKLVQSFTSQGIRISAKDSTGRTALDVAREYMKGGDPAMQRIVDILQDAVAKRLSLPFGRKEWKKYFGDVGKEPPLPANLLEIIEGPCPVEPNKKIADTHFLTLIPEKVNGRPLTLNYLEQLVKNPKGDGHETGYGEVYRGVDTEISTSLSHWVLMMKDPLPETYAVSYKKQCRSLEKFSHAKGVCYRVPKILEVAVCLFTDYVRGRKRVDPGEFFPTTFCEEVVEGKRLWIDCFFRGGLHVGYCKEKGGGEDMGLIGVRDL